MEQILVKKGYHGHKVFLSINEETNEIFYTLRFDYLNVNLSYVKKDVHELFATPDISGIILEFSTMYMKNIEEICEIIESYKKKYQHIKIIKVKFEEIEIADMTKIPDMILSDNNISELHFHNCSFDKYDENVLYQKNKKLEEVSVRDCFCTKYIPKQETRRGIVSGIMETMWSYAGLVRATSLVR